MFNRTPLASAISGCVANRVPAEAVDAMVAALLAAGADPNSIEMGDLPLLAAAARQCPGPVTEALHEAGGDLDARSPQGFTPLSLALIVKNIDAAETLVDLGARLSAASLDVLFPVPAEDPRLVALVERLRKDAPPE
jgi:ankyrin repeat protein